MRLKYLQTRTAVMVIFSVDGRSRNVDTVTHIKRRLLIRAVYMYIHVLRGRRF